MINKADKGANRLSELIARAKENGKDTSNWKKPWLTSTQNSVKSAWPMTRPAN